MAAILGGVSIPSSIVWTDRVSSPMVSQSVQRTLGGKAIISYSQQIGAMPITLSSMEDQGCVTLDIVEQLYLLSNVAGATYTLQIGTEEYTVAFRHNDPPAFSATPIIARSVPLDGDWFQVTIKLITV